MKLKKVFINISLILLAFLMLLPSILPGNSKSAIADSSNGSKYTTVLEDLAGTQEFMERDFPQVSTDYSLQVITIAESEDKELFIYVYQPSAYSLRLYASSINISTEPEGNVKFNNYKLEHLNSEGVYQKYLVKDFKVKDDAIRYYNISSIFRPWDKVLDKKVPDQNVTTEVSFAVAKECKAETKNGSVIYSWKGTEVVLITSRVDGFLEYSNGFKLFPSWCRSHYVAFSADYDIEHLLEADVYYVPVEVADWTYFFTNTKDIKRTPQAEKIAELSYTQSVEHEGSGWFAKTYKWDRIESVEDFIKNEELTDEAKKDLAGKEWVLRYVETKVQDVYYETSSVTYYTDITNVTILRLKFQTGGKLYNLGVVDNKTYQPFDREPDNKNRNEFDFGMGKDCSSFNYKRFLIIVGIILLIIILLPLFLPYIPAIIKLLLKAIWYLITWPYYLIKWLLDKK